MHFAEPALDGGDSGAVAMATATAAGAIGERLHLVFQGIQGAARHGLRERVADRAEIVAQRRDRVFEATRPAHHVELARERAQVPVEFGGGLAPAGRIRAAIELVARVAARRSIKGVLTCLDLADRVLGRLCPPLEGECRAPGFPVELVEGTDPPPELAGRNASAVDQVVEA